MSGWTLRQQRRYDPRGNGPQNHAAARRAVRYLKRHAWEFHGAGIDAAVADLVAATEGARRMNISIKNMRSELAKFSEAFGGDK